MKHPGMRHEWQGDVCSFFWNDALIARMLKPFGGGYKNQYALKLTCDTGNNTSYKVPNEVESDKILSERLNLRLDEPLNPNFQFVFSNGVSVQVSVNEVRALLARANEACRKNNLPPI
jgi:hypothetical protein